ncbi:MAG: primosomal protein N' family DNA-binding protein, partial [Planctomycetota bacterium]
MELFEGNTSGSTYIEAAFNLPLDRTYSYAVPAELAARVAPGKRVEAPFGPRRLVG